MSEDTSGTTEQDVIDTLDIFRLRICTTVTNWKKWRVRDQLSTRYSVCVYGDEEDENGNSLEVWSCHGGSWNECLDSVLCQMGNRPPATVGPFEVVK